MKPFKKRSVIVLLPFLALLSCQSVSASSSSSSTSSAFSDPMVPEGYHLAWSDEFDGDKVDPDYWTPLLGNGSGGWGNNELEYYQSANATVNGGVLTLEAKKEDVGSFHYTSARLVTARKESTTYGFIEARISLPAQNAMWPAFWMLPENGSWPTSGEIDIMENKGSSPWTTSGALHYANGGGHTYQYSSHTFSQRNGEENITGWHVYAIEWSEEAISWYVDGVSFLTVEKRVWHPEGGTVYTKDDSAPFNQPFHILLNLAVGGNFDSAHTTPDADFTSAEMKVDYVRVFEAE
jgi:beta-glucanase (GH16 family)